MSTMVSLLLLIIAVRYLVGVLFIVALVWVIDTLNRWL